MQQVSDQDTESDHHATSTSASSSEDDGSCSEISKAKRNRRREQNRLAAQRCRERKRAGAKSVVQDYKSYLSANTEVKHTIRQLEKQKEELLSILAKHSQDRTCKIGQNNAMPAVIPKPDTSSNSNLLPFDGSTSAKTFTASFGKKRVAGDISTLETPHSLKVRRLLAEGGSSQETLGVANCTGTHSLSHVGSTQHSSANQATATASNSTSSVLPSGTQEPPLLGPLPPSLYACGRYAESGGPGPSTRQKIPSPGLCDRKYTLTRRQDSSSSGTAEDVPERKPNTIIPTVVSFIADDDDDMETSTDSHQDHSYKPDGQSTENIYNSMTPFERPPTFQPHALPGVETRNNNAQQAATSKWTLGKRRFCQARPRGKIAKDLLRHGIKTNGYINTEDSVHNPLYMTAQPPVRFDFDNQQQPNLGTGIGIVSGVQANTTSTVVPVPLFRDSEPITDLLTVAPSKQQCPHVANSDPALGFPPQGACSFEMGSILSMSMKIDEQSNNALSYGYSDNVGPFPLSTSPSNDLTRPEIDPANLGQGLVYAPFITSGTSTSASSINPPLTTAPANSNYYADFSNECRVDNFK